MDMDTPPEENPALLSTPTHNTRGRKKKKSAVAKLAERRRKSNTSDGGSEFGSTASLQKPADKPESKDTSVKVASLDSQQKNDLFESPSNDSVFKETEQVTPARRILPKAPPRKLNVRKNNDSESVPELQPASELEGGVVVSIYDKAEKPPTIQKRREPSPARRQHKPQSKKDKTDQEKQNGKLTEKNGNGEGIFSLLPPAKARGGLSPLDGSDRIRKVQHEESPPPVPMDVDIDFDEEKEDKHDEFVSNNAPSDATVHRFRALKMAPDRSRSEESLKNSHFVPKPPSTPRSGRQASKKGEKRNRETNSSGEEADVETKKQVADTEQKQDTVEKTMKVDLKEKPFPALQKQEEKHKKGITVHPEALIAVGLNANQNMNSGLSPEVKTASLVTQPSSSGEKSTKPIEIGAEKVPDKLKKSSPVLEKRKTSKPKFKKGKVVPLPLDGATEKMDDVESPNPSVKSLDTIGSASDLKAVVDSYQEVLNINNEPVKGSKMPPSGLPSSKAGGGKLAPIHPKHLPPPLPHDMKSSTLRTAYKADPSYTMAKYFGTQSLSMPGTTVDRSLADNISQRSFASAGHHHTLSTKEVKESRIHHGTTTLLSSTELDRYFPERKVALWVGSLNMAEVKDCKESLDDFLLPEVSEYVQDIYAIGTQENAMNKKEWEILLQETLGPSHVLFHSATHGALHLAIFIKRDYIWFCTVPEDDLVQTRAVTMVKTKGAVAIGFSFFGTSFLFINCHLAPGDGKKKDRLDDYDRIIKHLSLPKVGNNASPSSSSKDVTTRYDCVFWMGDLNFRIEVYTGKEAVEEIVRHIQEQQHPNFEDLVAGDQLTKLIVEGTIFQGFQEGRINFRPTYKFDIGKDTYDTSSKNRIPSYTDRVLFRSKKKNSITCTHYDAPALHISDHRPVFALFEAAIKPARDSNLPLAVGQFDRSVYAEANKRLSRKVEVVQAFQKDKSSSVCVIQ